MRSDNAQLIRFSGGVCFNPTERPIMADGLETPDAIILHAIWKILEKPDGTEANLRELEKATDIVVDSDVCLPPSYFFRKGGGFPSFIVGRMVAGRLGIDLLEQLEPLGLSRFVNKQSEEIKPKFAAQLARIVAVLSMSTVGAYEVEKLPVEAVHKFLDWFRTPDGSRWRDDLPMKGLPYQCLREVAIALARYYGDLSLLDKAGVRRERYSGVESRTWKELSTSELQFDRDLFEHATEFMETSRTKSNKCVQIAMDLGNCMRAEAGKRGLLEFMQDEDRVSNLARYYIDNSGASVNHKISQLNVAVKFCASIAKNIKKIHGQIKLQELVVPDDVEYAKVHLPEPGKRRGHAMAADRALPERYYAELQKILASNWPRKCGKFDVKLYYKGSWTKVYCPVLPTLFRLMMLLPWRMSQWKRVDSGEGDLRRFNAKTMKWEENPSPHAGYWADPARGSEATEETKGYAHEFKASGLTGFFSNTNKSGEPWAIPWENKEVHMLLWEVLEWQEKYNPVDGPATGNEYTGSQRSGYSRRTVREMPDIFALFRMFKEKTNKAPPSSGAIDHAWQWIMVRLEQVVNLGNDGERIRFVSYNDVTGQAQGALYTPHGLRSRGLTNLYRSGVPIDLLSQMVAGHASIVMTLYYMAWEPSAIHDVLQKAAVETQSRQAREFMADFRNWKIAEARERSMSTDPLAVEVALQSNSLFCNVDIGFCPNDATRCEEGDALARANAKDYNPNVRVLCNGRNCVLCPFFVSGPPWINQLFAYGEKLLEQRKYYGARSDEIDLEVNNLLTQQRDGHISQEERWQREDSREAEIKTIRTEWEVVENAIYNVEVLITGSQKIIDRGNGPGQSFGRALVSNDRREGVEYLQTNSFAQAAKIVAFGRIYPLLADQRVEANRDKAINEIMYNNGAVPLTLRSRLTEKQKQRGMDLFAEWFLATVPEKDLPAVLDGNLRLQDIDDRLGAQIENLLDVVLSDPVLLDGPYAALQQTRQLALA